MLKKPETGEFAAYYSKYVDLVPEGDLADILENQMKETLDLMKSVGEDRGGHRYEPGKWSIKELFGHVVDTERIMSYRVLRIARGDQFPLEGYDMDKYAVEGQYDNHTLEQWMNEYTGVRLSTIGLVRGVPVTAWIRRGIANNYEVTARAAAYVLAGHELHHLKVLKERYL